jgi:hypothetical protein
MIPGKLVTKMQYVSYNLFQSTFRIPQSERADLLLVLKKYVNFIKTLFLTRGPFANTCIKENDKGIFIYDVLNSAYTQRKNYVNHFSKETVSGGIFKSELYYSKFGLGTFFVFGLATVFLPFLIFSSLFKKDKAPFAVIFKEILETINLLNFVKEFKINKLYFFCIYEKDANLCTLILQQHGVQIHKIPSEVPLGIWNKIIVADTLCICNGYQYDEIKEFKDSIFINETEFWGPENVLENIEKYKLPVETKKQTIGFYSTGAWVRKLENHIDQGFDMQTMEEQVKLAIKEFCSLNPEYTLLVFLHPREKWPKYMNQTIEKYKKDFEGVKFHLSENTKSSNSFEEADFGIAFQSTIVYERLYFGFKIIMMPVGTANFPVSEGGMKSICAISKEDLFEKIKSNIYLDNSQFFEKNNIKHFAKFLYN